MVSNIFGEMGPAKNTDAPLVPALVQYAWSLESPRFWCIATSNSWGTCLCRRVMKAKRARGHARQLVEAPAEVALVGESSCESDVSEREVCAREQLLRTQ